MRYKIESHQGETEAMQMDEIIQGETILKRLKAKDIPMTSFFTSLVSHPLRGFPSITHKISLLSLYSFTLHFGSNITNAILCYVCNSLVFWLLSHINNSLIHTH